MNKLISLILTQFLAISLISAQGTEQIHKCGFDHAVRLMEEAHPGYQQAVNRAFQTAKNHVSHTRNDIYKINVVVHVVYKTPEENVSDQRIEAVIARLNEDFRRTNANAADLRSEFDDIVGDPLIEFELSHIERVETTATFELDIFGGGALPDNVKQTAQGGSDAWDTSEYMNIWVCKLEGAGLLGYAYPPSCAPNWPAGSTAPSPELDGVVIHVDAFDVGTIYTIPADTIIIPPPLNILLGDTVFTPPTPVNIEGRTPSHEIGHYLGLRHIWGDGQSAQLGTPDCVADDGISDTPNQGLPSNFMCDATANTCNDGAGDKKDMWENYMDYADELCMSSFTMGQIDVMRGSLETCRTGIYTVVVNTGTEESQALAQSISIQPNPTTGIINLGIEFEDNDEYQITVRDVIGRQVKGIETARGSSNQTIDLTDQANGVFFVEIIKNGVKTAKKIVLAK